MGDNIDIDNQNKIKEQFNNIFKNSPLPKTMESLLSKFNDPKGYQQQISQRVNLNLNNSHNHTNTSNRQLLQLPMNNSLISTDPSTQTTYSHYQFNQQFQNHSQFYSTPHSLSHSTHQHHHFQQPFNHPLPINNFNGEPTTLRTFTSNDLNWLVNKTSNAHKSKRIKPQTSFNHDLDYKFDNDNSSNSGQFNNYPSDSQYPYQYPTTAYHQNQSPASTSLNFPINTIKLTNWHILRRRSTRNLFGRDTLQIGGFEIDHLSNKLNKSKFYSADIIKRINSNEIICDDGLRVILIGKLSSPGCQGYPDIIDNLFKDGIPVNWEEIVLKADDQNFLSQLENLSAQLNIEASYKYDQWYDNGSNDRKDNSDEIVKKEPSTEKLINKDVTNTNINNKNLNSYSNNNITNDHEKSPIYNESEDTVVDVIPRKPFPSSSGKRRAHDYLNLDGKPKKKSRSNIHISNNNKSDKAHHLGSGSSDNEGIADAIPSTSNLQEKKNGKRKPTAGSPASKTPSKSLFTTDEQLSSYKDHHRSRLSGRMRHAPLPFWDFDSSVYRSASRKSSFKRHIEISDDELNVTSTQKSKGFKDRERSKEKEKEKKENELEKQENGRNIEQEKKIERERKEEQKREKRERDKERHREKYKEMKELKERQRVEKLWEIEENERRRQLSYGDLTNINMNVEFNNNDLHQSDNKITMDVDKLENEKDVNDNNKVKQSDIIEIEDSENGENDNHEDIEGNGKNQKLRKRKASRLGKELKELKEANKLYRAEEKYSKNSKNHKRMSLEELKRKRNSRILRNGKNDNEIQIEHQQDEHKEQSEQQPQNEHQSCDNQQQKDQLQVVEQIQNEDQHHGEQFYQNEEVEEHEVCQQQEVEQQQEQEPFHHTEIIDNQEKNNQGTDEYPEIIEHQEIAERSQEQQQFQHPGVIENQEIAGQPEVIKHQETKEQLEIIENQTAEQPEVIENQETAEQSREQQQFQQPVLIENQIDEKSKAMENQETTEQQQNEKLDLPESDKVEIKGDEEVPLTRLRKTQSNDNRFTTKVKKIANRVFGNNSNDTDITQHKHQQIIQNHRHKVNQVKADDLTDERSEESDRNRISQLPWVNIDNNDNSSKPSSNTSKKVTRSRKRRERYAFSDED